MVQKTLTNSPVDSLIRECAETLQRMADYKLPIPLDRRLLWLSENKEQLTEAEREELVALVEFSEDRTVDRLQARVVIRRLHEAWPQLFGHP